MASLEAREAAEEVALHAAPAVPRRRVNVVEAATHVHVHVPPMSGYRE